MILRQFCLQTDPWYFLNLRRRRWIDLTAQTCVAYFAKDVGARLVSGGTLSITDRGRVARNDEDIPIPAARTEFDSIDHDRDPCQGMAAGSGVVEFAAKLRSMRSH
jgi:hypothetical protein